MKIDPKEVSAKLQLATLASCSCLTKTPEIAYHEPHCRYRVLAEAKILIDLAYNTPAPEAA